jgi:hypothetical protein
MILHTLVQLPKFPPHKSSANPVLIPVSAALIPFAVLLIHKYRGNAFMYVVARTNKHLEDYVKGDVEKMNGMLSPEMRAEGIWYVFALGTVDSMNKKTGERTSRKKGKQEENDSNADTLVSSLNSNNNSS